MQVVLLAPGNPRWSRFLENADHDVYQVPGYVGLSSFGPTQGDARALLVEDNEQGVLIPLVMRKINRGQWDAASPYGYPGFVTSPELSEEDQIRLITFAFDWLSANDCVSFFLRLHPLLNRNSEVLSGLHVGHRVTGEVAVVSLKDGAAVATSNMRKSCRYDIARARRLGYKSYVDSDLRWLKEFAELYRDEMRRIGAKESYLFPDDYFEQLARLDGRQFHLRVIEIDGKLTAGACFIGDGAFLSYHLSATNPEFRKFSPAKLAVADAIEWGVDHGYATLNLGGGLGGGDDPLSFFKKGFGSEAHSFLGLGVICQNDSYNSLTEDLSLSGPSDFFPAYRAKSS